MEIEKMKCDRCKGTGIDPDLPDNFPCRRCTGIKELDWIQNARGGFTLNRMQKAFLSVVNDLNHLEELGLITKGPFELDERAIKIAKSFEPTKEEMEAVMFYLKQNGYIA